MNLTLNDDEPLLVRGALAEGEVRHVKGIFLKSNDPANLVGQGVVDAVVLEQSSGLKGPRILIAEQLARELPQAFADWLLRPTSAPGVCEVLWLLPPDPASFSVGEGVSRGLWAYRPAAPSQRAPSLGKMLDRSKSVGIAK